MKDNPGCFGHVSVFNRKSKICEACSLKSACDEEVGKKLISFASQADIADYVKRHGAAGVPGVTKITKTSPARTSKVIRIKPEYTEEEIRMMESVSSKASAELRKIIDAGTHKAAKKMLQARQNPFPYEGKRFLHVACSMLLETGFTKASLRQHYMQHLGWTKNTAFPHVTIACAVLQALGIAVDDKGMFVLSPECSQ